MASNDALSKAKEKLEEQRDVLNKIMRATPIIGVVIKPDKMKQITEDEQIETADSWIVAIEGNGIREVAADPRLKIKSGDTVKIFQSQGGFAIIDVSKDPIKFGDTLEIVDFDEKKNLATVTIHGMKRVVYPGRFKKDDLEPGTEVMVYAGCVITDINPSSKKNYVLEQATGISWDEIGGLDAEKAKMREAIENPILFADLYKAYNQKKPKGILLYGPPGNGKTMLGKAAATAIAELHKTTEKGFIYVKGPEILSRFVGDAEERIRGIFAQAREFSKKHNSQAIIFVDEAESILSRRGSGVSSDMEKTIVPQFLSEMDGLNDSGAIVILTTNRADMLDPAVIREGRIDQKIYVGNPDQVTARAILGLNLKDVPVSGGDDPIEVILELLYSEKYSLFTVVLDTGAMYKLTLGDLASGATIATIVKSIINLAMNRDIESKSSTASGIQGCDAAKAIDDLYNQYFKLDHKDFLDVYKKKLAEDGTIVKSVTKLIHTNAPKVVEADYSTVES